MPIYNVSDFSASGNAAAGKSPSFRAKLASDPDGPNYQLKSSNSTRTTRKLIGYDPDSSDMLGEFLASVKMRADYEQLGITTKAELSPEVSLVLDQDANRVMLASKYLNDKTGVEAAGMTIDELWYKKLEFEGKKKPDKGHVRLVMPGKGTGRDDEIEMDKEFTIKVKDQEFTLKIDSKEVAQAIVKSAKYGDHDVNPGNMFYVVDVEQKKGFVGRIDYGHAFNDLIKNFKLIGSGKNLPIVESGRGLVLDYFNRDSVNMDKTTKFMRDYGGMTPSEEMISALREEAARDMKPMYEALVKGMKDFSEGLENSSPELQKELRSSLMTLSKRIGSPLKKMEFKNNDDMCAVFATKIMNSIENN